MLNNEITAADSGINVWAESAATFSARTLKSIKLARGVGRNAVEEPPKIAPKSYPPPCHLFIDTKTFRGVRFRPLLPDSSASRALRAASP